MRTLRQISIKNRQNYFFNSLTNIKNFDPSLLSINQVSFKSTDDVIYDNEYISMKSLESANSLYFVFDNVDACIEKNSEDKYLIFAFTDKNKEVLGNCTELWDEIKDQIEIISGNKPTKYGKDFMKIKSKSDDNLPLGKILNALVCIIAVAYVFQGDNNYVINVCMSMNIKMKMILVPLYKCNFCTIYIALL